MTCPHATSTNLKISLIQGRISVEEALEHPFLAKYHDPTTEPFCPKPFDFSFESTHLSKESLKAALQTEIDIFKVKRMGCEVLLFTQSTRCTNTHMHRPARTVTTNTHALAKFFQSSSFFDFIAVGAIEAVDAEIDTR